MAVGKNSILRAANAGRDEAETMREVKAPKKAVGKKTVSAKTAQKEKEIFKGSVNVLDELPIHLL